MTKTYSALYVAAAAAANLIIAAYGPPAVPVVSFLLVGFVITTRDRLHDEWHGDLLALRMVCLVAAGAAVTFAINAEALPIAIASTVAFGASEAVNALVYEPLRRRGVGWYARVNSGNVANAITDSVLFVTLAFGFSLRIVVLQVAAKVLGGAVWSAVVRSRHFEPVAAQ